MFLNGKKSVLRMTKVVMMANVWNHNTADKGPGSLQTPRPEECPSERGTGSPLRHSSVAGVGAQSDLT